jgi:hypothetical protein
LRGFAGYRGAAFVFEEQMTKKKTTRAPKTCEGCSRWKEVKRQIRVSELLAKAVKEIEARVKANELKPTMGDYLKLLQLEQEFAQESPKEIKVTWVEPPVPSSAE